ncbi:hypothetical protein DERF_012969 [Dermatophagoides farinae]|uniref:Transmembrane protein n=1 Tax=Dermatophagoides farinae TaxID=6954 RepID=A0A922KXY0_DERFA|nr:putative leucine-rich repeat-containing protein DDB_G0290503 [Dermatophagoides farinae]KAH7644927.1 hypothetical protein HUG17_0465 [Dermatophagoides farinae]KAH9496948.1 hypothetical protein DERF_012969 [Dermatophagoides farinae]
MKLSLLIGFILAIHIGHSIATNSDEQTLTKIDAKIENLNKLLKQKNADSIDDDIQKLIEKANEIVERIQNDCQKAVDQGRKDIDDIIKKISNLVGDIMVTIGQLLITPNENKQKELKNQLNNQLNDLENLDTQLNSSSSIVQSTKLLLLIMVINFLIFKSFN